MTNKEIIEQIDKGESWEYMNTTIVTAIGNLPAALDLARQDEREKMQGVDCFISWDGRDSGTVDAWHNDEPRKGENDMFYGSSDINGKHSHISELHKDFAKLLGIEQGQCKKFRIVEELP